MAPSPATTMPSIIWRTDCATSGSAGSSQRNDRSTRVPPSPESTKRVVMCMTVGWSAMISELTPGVCGNDPHVDQAAPVVAVKLAAQVLASRAGLGFDGVGEEIALHHFRLEHSPVG